MEISKVMFGQKVRPIPARPSFAGVPANALENLSRDVVELRPTVNLEHQLSKMVLFDSGERRHILNGIMDKEHAEIIGGVVTHLYNCTRRGTTEIVAIVSAVKTPADAVLAKGLSATPKGKKPLHFDEIINKIEEFNTNQQKVCGSQRTPQKDLIAAEGIIANRRKRNLLQIQ